MSFGDWVALLSLISAVSAAAIGAAWRIGSTLAELSTYLKSHVEQQAVEQNDNRDDHHKIWGTLADHEHRIDDLEDQTTTE